MNGFNYHHRWRDAGRPSAVVTHVRVGGYDQCHLRWEDKEGNFVANQFVQRRDTGLSREDFEAFLYEGATINFAPKDRWITLL